MASSLPICVDLDGTLMRTDTLYESALAFIKRKPWAMLLLVWWLLWGKSHLKQKLAEHINLAVATFPYNAPLIKWLQAEKQTGRKLYLVTASHEKYAQGVAQHLGIFDGVYASSATHNLKGKHKAAFLNQQFGKGQYAYVGDHAADLAVWAHCDAAILVHADKRTHARCQKIAPIAMCFPKPPFSIKTWLKAIRVHQYAKNILIFLPLLLGHQLSNLGLLVQTLLAFIAFSALASSVYLLNDLLDLESDRRHPKKSLRALASGALSIPTGILLGGLCFVIALILCAFLPWKFQLILACYYGLTLLYSFLLKQKVLLDILALSALYTLRILAGMALIPHGYSDWLVLFSLFFFTSLAFAKRYTELYGAIQNHKLQKLHGRGYHTDQLSIIGMLGIASGYISTLVLALYLNSQQALALYGHPRILYLICPIVLYWVSRIWLKTSMGEMDEDPVVFALKDKVSYVLVGLSFIIALLATFL